MQARETQLLTLLAGQHQFVIPIFQRDYSWGGDECRRLVEDVLAVADGPDGAIHFLGSVVCARIEMWKRRTARGAVNVVVAVA